MAWSKLYLNLRTKCPQVERRVTNCPPPLLIKGGSNLSPRFELSAYFGQLVTNRHGFNSSPSSVTSPTANFTSCTNAFISSKLSLSHRYQNKNCSSKSRQCSRCHMAASSSRALKICLASAAFNLLARGSNSNPLVDGSICIKEPPPSLVPPEVEFLFWAECACLLYMLVVLWMIV